MKKFKLKFLCNKSGDFVEDNHKQGFTDIIAEDYDSAVKILEARLFELGYKACYLHLIATKEIVIEPKIMLFTLER